MSINRSATLCATTMTLAVRAAISLLPVFVRRWGGEDHYSAQNLDRNGAALIWVLCRDGRDAASSFLHQGDWRCDVFFIRYTLRIYFGGEIMVVMEVMVGI